MSLPIEPVEEPYEPRSRTPLLAAAGAVLGVVAYVAIRAVVGRRRS
jgi:hypothetical protein